MTFETTYIFPCQKYWHVRALALLLACALRPCLHVAVKSALALSAFITLWLWLCSCKWLSTLILHNLYSQCSWKLLLLFIVSFHCCFLVLEFLPVFLAMPYFLKYGNCQLKAAYLACKFFGSKETHDLIYSSFFVSYFGPVASFTLVCRLDHLSKESFSCFLCHSLDRHLWDLNFSQYTCMWACQQRHCPVSLLLYCLHTIAAPM